MTIEIKPKFSPGEFVMVKHEKVKIQDEDFSITSGAVFYTMGSIDTLDYIKKMGSHENPIYVTYYKVNIPSGGTVVKQEEELFYKDEYVTFMEDCYFDLQVNLLRSEFEKETEFSTDQEYVKELQEKLDEDINKMYEDKVNKANERLGV